MDGCGKRAVSISFVGLGRTRIPEGGPMASRNLRGLGRRISLRAAYLPAAWLGVAICAPAATLPDGPGKAETTRVCGKCHLLEQAVSLRQGQAGWKETVSKMIDLGAEGSDAEFSAILNYLAKNFGGGNSNPSSPAPAPSIALPPLTQSPGNASAPDGARAAEPPSRHDRPKSLEAFQPGPPIPAAKEWPTYGHDPGGRRFSPLTELTPENVGRLKIAWIYHMRPAGFAAGAGRFSTGERRGPGGAVGDTPTPSGGARGPGRGNSGFRPSEETPLVRNGIMYIATPYSRVVAVDPVTGEELWSFHLPSGNASTRGVEFWAGDEGRRRRSSSAPATVSCIA